MIASFASADRPYYTREILYHSIDRLVNAKYKIIIIVDDMLLLYNCPRGDIMIRNAKEMISELKHEMRGGKGDVEITNIFSQNELTGKARLCARITINPGCSIGLHEHLAEEEIFYIISGEGLVNDNGTVKEVAAGDAILTGNGASHSIENIGKVPLVLVAVILLFQ